MLQDIAPDGRVLLVHRNERGELRASAAGGPEQDLSWRSSATVPKVSQDGSLIAFSAESEGTGEVYLRKSDGSPAVRLGEGIGMDLSPDGRWILAAATLPGALIQNVLYPTGLGQSRKLAPESLSYHLEQFFPDGARFLVSASQAGRPGRTYVQSVAGGILQPLTPEGVEALGPFTADGKFFAASDVRDGHVKTMLWPVAGGAARPLVGLDPRVDRPVVFTADGRSLLVRQADLPMRAFLLDLTTGQRRLWRTFGPADPTGVASIAQLSAAADLRSYAYTYRLRQCDLYLVDGLR